MRPARIMRHNWRGRVSTCCFGGAFLASETAQIAERPAFAKQQRDSCQADGGERDQPDDNRRDGGVLAFHPINDGKDQERRQLRSSADAGKLQRRAHQREYHHQQGVAKMKVGEPPAETIDHPKVHQRVEKPMQRGEADGNRQVGHVAKAMQAVHKRREKPGNARDLRTTFSRRVQPRGQRARSVEANVDEKYNRGQCAKQQHSAGMARVGQQRGSFGAQSHALTDDKKSDAGGDGGGGKIENALDT